MAPRKAITRLILAVLAILPLAAGCASTSYIEVTYQLPAPQQSIAPRTVSLQVVDKRPADTIAGPHSKEELEHFTGLFSLYMTRTGKDPLLIGAFDLTALFREAFKQRFTSEGITVLDQPADDQPVVEIQLNEFILDRDGKNWTATLAYKAITRKANRVLTTQTVSGEAERLKLVGTRDAEKLLGEIFSDMVNRLDPVKLFNHPDL